MINKMVSSKSVIAKIIADLDLDEKDLKITDIKQWIADAIEQVGAVQQYIQKVVTLPIINYQVKLPCDLHKINQVAYSLNNCNGFLPMRRSTHQFMAERWEDDEYCKKECDDKMIIQDKELIVLVKNLYNLTDDSKALEILNNDKNVRQTLETLINQYTLPTSNGAIRLGMLHKYQMSLQYDVKPGWIVCNVPKGFVKISYTAIATDEDSMPLIPDDQYYFEAIFWYVAMKLSYPKVLKGQMHMELYNDMRRSWLFYRKQAYGNAMMPSSRDEMKTIQNVWNKLYPEIDDHDTFFSELGDEQIIYNQNR